MHPVEFLWKNLLQQTSAVFTPWQRSMVKVWSGMTPFDLTARIVSHHVEVAAEVIEIGRDPAEPLWFVVPLADGNVALVWGEAAGLELAPARIGQALAWVMIEEKARGWCP